MKFTVAPEIFAALPGLYIGVVVADGVDNATARPAIEAQLHTAITAAAARWQGVKIREAPAIAPYRAAFQALGINPNKYPCSIETLLSSIGKGKGLPAINPLVDLNNAISLQHTLPMGTHDLGGADDDITLRPARAGDVFLPFGGGATETPDVGEAVYAVGQQIRTRRWTWRQSEHGKITAATRRVFSNRRLCRQQRRTGAARGGGAGCGIAYAFRRCGPPRHRGSRTPASGNRLNAAADIVKHLENRNGVASPCRTTCTVCGDAPCYAFLSIQL